MSKEYEELKAIAKQHNICLKKINDANFITYDNTKNAD